MFWIWNLRCQISGPVGFGWTSQQLLWALYMTLLITMRVTMTMRMTTMTTATMTVALRVNKNLLTRRRSLRGRWRFPLDTAAESHHVNPLYFNNVLPFESNVTPTTSSQPKSPKIRCLGLSTLNRFDFAWSRVDKLRRILKSYLGSQSRSPLSRPNWYRP